MKIGKLYQIKEYFWLLYPSKDSILHSSIAIRRCSLRDTSDAAKYYSFHLNCNVSYLEPKSIFCLIERDRNCLKVLSNNGQLGWIFVPDDWCDNECFDIGL